MVWGIREGGRTVWLDGANYTESAQAVERDVPLIRTESNLEGLPGSVVQEAFVHSDKDILAVRVRISPAVDGEVGWYADISPCAALAPEAPFLESLWIGARDFAAFVDGSVVYHVRPSELTSTDWHEARLWARSPAGIRPDCLNRDGVWIAYASPDGFATATCKSILESDRTAGPEEDEFLSEGTAAAGNCASAAIPNLSDHERERSATVFVAFGSSREEVDRNIAFALDRGFDGLLNATRDAWAPVMDGAAQRVSPTAPELRAPLTRALATVFTATSQESGAIVRAPGAQPLLALDYPRHSVWAGLALDYLGLTASSERHLRFLLSLVRTQDGPGTPAGSISAASYGDGTPGLPHVVLDADAAGWLLWAVRQHGDYLDEGERARFVGAAWPQIENLAAFLYARSDPASGIPIYSFDPRSLRDAATDESLIAHYIGLRSAASLSQIVQESRPEWQDRAEQLQDALTSRAFAADGTWTAKRPLSFWATAVADADDPRWDPVCSEVLAGFDEEAPDRAMADLCDLALLWRNRPERLERLKPLLVPVIERSRKARPLDTLDAARAILTILIVNGS